MICVECGKRTDKLFNGMCIDCYINSKRFFEFPHEIEIKVCRNCGAYNIDGEWKHENMKKLLREYILKNIKGELNCQPSIDFDRGIIRCESSFEGRRILEEGKFRIKIKKRLCDKCSLMKGGYFEAILQIRKMNKEMEKEMENIVKRRVNEANSFIMKKEKIKDGMDFYIGNKKVAHSIAMELKNIYKAEYKSSSSLVGMKDGQEIYRDTYLVRLPEYKVGTFIKLNNTIYRIESMGKKIELRSLSGERKYVYRNEIKKAKILDINEREATIIHEDKNEIYVMDPETYKTYMVRKSGKRGKIRIIEHEGKTYVIE